MVSLPGHLYIEDLSKYQLTRHANMCTEDLFYKQLKVGWSVLQIAKCWMICMSLHLYVEDLNEYQYYITLQMEQKNMTYILLLFNSDKFYIYCLLIQAIV